MNISLVCVTSEISKDSVHSHGYKMDLTDGVTAEPLDEDSEIPRIKKYCETLNSILKNDKETTGTLCIHFDWGQSQPNKMWVKLTGQLLEKLRQLCGKETTIDVEGHFGFGIFSQNFRNRAEFETARMEINLPSNAVGQRSTLKDAFCEDKEVAFSENHFLQISQQFRNNFSQFERIQINVFLTVQDEYLNQSEIDTDSLGLACKTIQEHRLHTDVSIVSFQAKDITFSANKCFLSAHSPVLRALLLGDFKESKTNTIEMGYSVECIKSLLDFVYTSHFPEAVKSSTLAVELFQAANYYQIKPLEEKLVEMLLLRSDSWFDANAAIELFCIASKIETWKNSSPELKKKAVQALKSKGDPRKFENFKKLFAEGWDVALELTVMALEN